MSHYVTDKLCFSVCLKIALVIWLLPKNLNKTLGLRKLIDPLQADACREDQAPPLRQIMNFPPNKLFACPINQYLKSSKYQPLKVT